MKPKQSTCDRDGNKAVIWIANGTDVKISEHLDGPDFLVKLCEECFDDLYDSRVPEGYESVKIN